MEKSATRLVRSDNETSRQVIPVTSAIGTLLKQVYSLHNEEMAGLRSQIDKVNQELNQMDDVTKRLRDENKKVHERVDAIETENKILREKSKRLSSSCRECEIYKQQISDLKKKYIDLYKQVNLVNPCSELNPEKNEPKKGTNSPQEDPPIFDRSKAKRQDVRNTHGGCVSNEVHKTKNSISPNQERTELNPKSPRHNLRLAKTNKRSRFSEELPPSKKQRHSNVVRPKEMVHRKDEVNTQDSASILNQCDSNDQHGKQRSTDSPVPAQYSKSKFKPLSGQMGARPFRDRGHLSVVPKRNKLSHNMDRSVRNEKEVEYKPKVLVPDTLSVDSPAIDYDPESCRKNVQKKPELVIPETVQVYAENSQELEMPRTVQYTEDVQEESQSQMNDQMTARCLDMSPPSHTSTPLCRNIKNKRPFIDLTQKDSLMEIFDDDIKSNMNQDSIEVLPEDSEGMGDLDERAVVKSPPAAYPDTYKPALSNTKRPPSVAKDYQSDSQSLFDDPESPVFHCHRKNFVEGNSYLTEENGKPSQSAGNEKHCNDEVSSVLQVNITDVSGSVLSKMEIRSPESDGWLSKGSKTRGRPAESQTDSQKFRRRIEEISREKENLSEPIHQPSPPGRMTRSQRRVLSQEKDSERYLDKSLRKSLKQTTLSQVFTVPKSTHLPEKKFFNGGMLGQGAKPVRTEQEDVEEAIKRSMVDYGGVRNHGLHQEPYSHTDMSVPEPTSSNGIKMKRKDKIYTSYQHSKSSSSESDSSFLFKKPPSPSKPKISMRKEKLSDIKSFPNQNLTTSTDDDQDETMNPNDVSVPLIPINRPFRSNRKGQAGHASEGTELFRGPSQSLLMNTEVGYANGSLDPDVNLSDAEYHGAGATVNPEFQETVSSPSDCEVERGDKKRDVNSRKTGKKQPAATSPSLSDFDSRDEVDVSRTSGGFVPKIVEGESTFHDESDLLQQGPSKKGSRNDSKLGRSDIKSSGYATQDPAEMDESEYLLEDELLDVHDDSFDKLPKVARPNFPYVEVVRKKAEREQLETFACPTCEQYYAGENLTEEERKERMKSCRHKARYVPPGTPDHFWSIGMPDTQECEERGYFNKTQHKPSKFRRKRGYKQLFEPANDDNDKK